ncbi:MAG: hypothetical protein AB7G11_15065 [Phycisphaerales bacterium]
MRGFVRSGLHRRVLAALVLTATATWCLWPMGALQTPAAQTPAGAGGGGGGRDSFGNEPVAPLRPSPLDLALFSRPLWPPVEIAESSPSAPVSTEKLAVPSQPLRLQLLAITREGDRYIATLYDPDADRLLSVSEGEPVSGAELPGGGRGLGGLGGLGGRVIESISPDAIRLLNPATGAVDTIKLVAAAPTSLDPDSAVHVADASDAR